MPKKVDLNQKEIVKVFRELGASVLIMSDLGKGAPDLLISLYGVSWLVEIKNGQLPRSAQKLTSAEQKFHDEWKGPIAIVNSVQGAIDLIEQIRKVIFR